MSETAFPTVTCRTCDKELPARNDCWAEQHPQMHGRTGRHAGHCWGGRFPKLDESPQRRVRPEKRRARHDLAQSAVTPTVTDITQLPLWDVQ